MHVWKFSKILSFSQELLILHAGHQVKSYRVLTSDGFYLTLHHIFPESHITRRNVNVLFMHGLFTNAADFLVVGKDRALREFKKLSSIGMRALSVLFSIFFSSITRYNFNFRALELIVFSTQHIFSLIMASMCGWPTREEVIMAWNTRHSTSIQTTSGISHFTRLECTIWEVDFSRDIRRWSEMNNLSISYLSCMSLFSFHRFRFKWI